jgi:hypothetical protein
MDRKHGKAVITKPKQEPDSGEFHWELFFSLKKGDCSTDRVWVYPILCFFMYAGYIFAGATVNRV